MGFDNVIMNPLPFCNQCPASLSYSSHFCYFSKRAVESFNPILSKSSLFRNLLCAVHLESSWLCQNVMPP